MYIYKNGQTGKGQVYGRISEAAADNPAMAAVFYVMENEGSRFWHSQTNSLYLIEN